jgi:hypothetical protein
MHNPGDGADVYRRAQQKDVAFGDSLEMVGQIISHQAYSKIGIALPLAGKAARATLEAQIV